MPQRIQRKRTKGWTAPPGALYVGRPSIYGNPYTPDTLHFSVSYPDGNVTDDVRSATWEECVEWFRRDLYCTDERCFYPGEEEHQWTALVYRSDLRGRDLMCWCPPSRPCHADVLLAWANQEGE